MKNTTNWYLYTSYASKAEPTENAKSKVLPKEIRNKINLIKKAIR